MNPEVSFSGGVRTTMPISLLFVIPLFFVAALGLGGVAAIEHISGRLRRVPPMPVLYASSFAFLTSARCRHAGLVRLAVDAQGVTVRSWLGPAFRISFTDAILESSGTFGVRYRVAGRAFGLWLPPGATAAIDAALHRFRDRERAALRGAQ